MSISASSSSSKSAIELQGPLPRISENEEKKEAIDCTICLENVALIQANQSPCNHFFHPNCILSWIDRGGNMCPNCNASLAGHTFQRIPHVPIDIPNDQIQAVAAPPGCMRRVFGTIINVALLGSSITNLALCAADADNTAHAVGYAAGSILSLAGFFITFKLLNGGRFLCC